MAPKRGTSKKLQANNNLGLDTIRGEPVYGDSLMSIMRPSHKQHVGLLPDDVSRGPKLSKPLSCVLIRLASLIPINPSQAIT